MNKELLQKIAEAGPLHITEEQKAYLRSITSVDWEQVDLTPGNKACAVLGLDPRTDDGKRAVIGLSLVSYFRSSLNKELLPIINQVIESWRERGEDLLVVLGTKEEIDATVAYNRAVNRKYYLFDPEFDD